MRVLDGGASGSPQTLISLDSEQVAPELVPVDELADCAQAAFARDGKTILSYGSGAGYTPLRELIGEWFRVDPSRVVLTHGAAPRARSARGPRRARPRRDGRVPDPRPGRAGATRRGRVSDQHPDRTRTGSSSEELQGTLGQYVRPAMVYVVPTFHNPTGWTTPAAARKRVVDLVITQNQIQTEQILLVEDETYALTRFEGERVPAHLRLLGRSQRAQLVLLGHGRAGAACRLPHPARAARRGADGRSHPTAYITPVLLAQATVYEFLARGAFEPHLMRLRDGLRVRRDALLAALARHLPDATWSEPEGGLFVWVQLPGSPDGREVLSRAEGVAAVDGTRFGSVSSSLRLSFGFAAPDELEAGVEMLAAAL